MSGLRDPGLAIEKALCAVQQRKLPSAADALVAAYPCRRSVNVFSRAVGDQALDVRFLANPERVVVTTDRGRFPILDPRSGLRNDIQVFGGTRQRRSASRRETSSRIVVGSGAGELAIVDVAADNPAHRGAYA